MLHPVCMSAPSLPLAPCPGGPAAHSSGTTTSSCQVRVPAIGRARAPLRLRARRELARAGAGDGSGATERVPVVGQSAGEQPRVEEVEAVAEVLESLTEAAIAGEDEGRRPTDYDRRAQIFEESSRVFRELKQRREGGGNGKAQETATH